MLKNKILNFLEKNRENYISGEKIAAQLNVSRSAVWKVINILKKEGYEIESSTNMGYRLKDECDVLSKEAIGVYLNEEFKNININVFKSIDSTNSQAKKMIAQGAKHGTVVLAEEQTCGRGRLGRSFYSPYGTGIYMSVILELNCDMSKITLITTAASVAVVRAAKFLGIEGLTIKWVNDIYLNSLKVCGILTEAITDCESATVQSVVVGIGLNVSTKQFPNDLKNIAGSITDENILRSRLAAQILNELFAISSNLEDQSLMEEYRKHSNVCGKDIVFIENGEKVAAKAIDIDKDGGLVVKLHSGDIKVLRSGEISIRGLKL